MRAILAFLLAMMAGASAAPIVTAEGPVEGFARKGVLQFLGIPYAAPPVGAWRWMPPQPVARWSTVKKADAFGPTCAQVTTLGPFAGPANSNEDCLYLNVFKPQQATGEKLPVLVWIHGGGYVDGESNDYDATKLALQGHMVVVTLNYRLNLFGFLAHPSLDHENHASGNYGILDIQAALQWTRRNIAAFGGDAGNVTLGGQSAGAGAAAANLVSPGARGLFHRAIFQSGGYTPFAPLAIAEERGERFAQAAGCGPADNMEKCLRDLPAAKIVALSGTTQANSRFINGPLVDGTVIPQQVIDAFRSGDFNQVPVIIGTTRDEGNFAIGIAQYFRPDHAPATLQDFNSYAANTYGGRAGPGGSLPDYAAGMPQAVLAHYPVSGDVQPAWTAAATDHLACRGQTVAQALSAHVPVYMYEFDDRTAPSYFAAMKDYRSQAYHTGDIAYLFPGYHGGPQGVAITLTPTQQALSDRMVGAWSSFALTGNPNSKGPAPWPRWQAGADKPAYFLQDDAWRHTMTNAQWSAAHQCAFWQSILLYK